jgi:cell division protease FtsH
MTTPLPLPSDLSRFSPGRLVGEARTRAAAVLAGLLGRLGGTGLALVGVVLVLLGVYFALLSTIQPVAAGHQLAFTDLTRGIESSSLRSAVLYDEDARVVVTGGGGRVIGYAAYPKSNSETSALMKSLRDHGVRVRVDQQAGKARLRFVVQFLLPLVILAALFGVVTTVTSGKGGAAEFAAFSKLKVKRHKVVGAERTTFASVAGAGEAVVELQEVVDYLKDPGRFAAVGARAPKGVLLVGPPGTGKTLLARAVAGEAGVPFFSLSGSEFVESLVGVGAARVRDLFRQAREAAPSILFIDEVDAAGRQRGAGMGQGNDEREQTLNQMLVEMDGFSVSAGVAVLAATNRPDILDPALLRPGRFDRQVVVDAPDVDGRLAILELYLKNRAFDDDAEEPVDVGRIARQTPGFTGAELANLVNEAALVAVRSGRAALRMDDLEEAVDRVVAGPARRSKLLSEDEKSLVAHHEAGHAVVAAAVGMATGVQKLSVVARGRTLGHTTTYQLADRLVLRQSDLRRQLVTTMGGLAVEELVFGEVTTGCEGDLHAASGLARTMVANLGMGRTLGRVAVGQKSGEVFLGRDFTKMQEVSPATLEAVDREIRTLLEQAEADALAILRANRAVVDRIASTLAERETLSGPALDAMLAGVVAFAIDG